MNIGLLGGSFNPPHLGHVFIAQQVLDFTNIDEVWFLPNYGQQPPKTDVAEVSDRLAMTKLIALPRTKVSTIEIDHKLSGDTIELLPYLPSEHRFAFIMGSDWLPTFTQWPRWEELVEKLPFLVFPRQGHPTAPLYQNMTLVDNPLLMTTDISATKVRERVKAGLALHNFVPRAVENYIKSQKLYFK